MFEPKKKIGLLLALQHWSVKGILVIIRYQGKQADLRAFLGSKKHEAIFQQIKACHVC
ncbi:hypothetical protein NC651_014030 [Populus alba x Populus x berolinensis]|nr:hypothetical protein NC651_014030 [Populus alba x Populus x berolinensis]